jgi:hypothetical protein
MWLASDNTQTRYKAAVNEAIISEQKFNTFKSNPNYNCIVGMSELWQAPLFYEFIKNNNKEIFEKLDEFKKNDLIGAPVLWSGNGITISPNTLRYIKTLVDLQNHFGSLNDFVVAELGVGYGGLSFMINTNAKLKDYVLCDLPEVQQLAKKYLSSHNITATDDKEKHDNFDLFISEFCLSEFDDKEIYEFYDKLILKSKRVYLMMNLHDESRKKKFLSKISQDFNINILDEYPKTMWPNYIIIGTKK